MRDDEKCCVGTLRAQCQVHRVYHCITMGLALFSNFVTGQIKLALSLRGPSNFTKFKSLLWTWRLEHLDYRWEEPQIGPGEAADAHIHSIYNTRFPTCRDRQQRRNRLKYWVVRKLANGDIRRTEVFAHNCGDGCCRSKKDFLRRLKWFVAIVAGKMLIIFPRSRWTKMDEAIDWVGLLQNIHGLLRSVYTLWLHHVMGRKVP